MAIGSYVAIRWRDGMPDGYLARQLGDVTSNQTEHEGLIACLRDALRRRVPCILVEIDSRLVVMQASLLWQCRSETLLVQ